MSYQHKDLAGGRWNQLSFLKQMANIGSEVERAFSWRAKNNLAYSEQALYRALELIDLSLEVNKGSGRLKELARMREAILDYFVGSNQLMSTEGSWKQYFSFFYFAALKNR